MYANDDMVRTALHYYGVEEHRGPERNNSKIVGWLRDVLPWASKDETPWCSAFMWTVAGQVGAQCPPQDKAAAAASWLRVGYEVQDEEILQGDVVVLRRGKGWQRHVGLIISSEVAGTHIWVLGGNQRNRVSIARYRADRIDSVRRISILEEIEVGG